MDRYRTYKSNTKTFLEWFKTTLATAGYRFPSPAPANHGTITTRKYVLSTKDILDATNFMATKNPDWVINMPRKVKHALRQAIDGRKKHAEMYQQQASQEAESSDGHIYYIDVLETVSKILEGCTQNMRPVPARALTPVASSGMKPAYMRYELLGSDGNNEIDDDTTHVVPSKSNSKPAAQVELEIQVDPTEELRFRTFCMFKDFDKIRDDIVAVWSRHHTGALDTLTATIITEAAVELLNQEAEAITASAKDLGIPFGGYFDYSCLTPIQADALFTLSRIDDTPESVVLPSKLRHSNPESELAEDPEKALFVDRDEYLCEYIVHLSFENSHIRKLNSKAPSSIALRTAQDQVSASLLGLIHRPISVFAADVLLSLQSLALRNDKTPLDLARPYGYGSGELAVGAALDDDASMVSPRWKYLADALADVAFWITPFKFREIPRLEKHRETHHVPSLEVDFLRRRNPVLCGKLLLNLSVVQEEFGLEYMAIHPFAVAMSHLVNALRQTGHISGTWKDMDAFTEMHIKSIFRGELPTTLDQIRTRFSLTCGADPKILAAKKLNHNNGRRHAQPAIGGRQSVDQMRLPTTPTIQALREYVDGTESLHRTLYRLDSELQKSTKTKKPKSFIDESGIRPFVQELEKTMPPVMARLTFDYFGLTKTCRELFDKMGIETELGDQHNSRGLWISSMVISELAKEAGRKPKPRSRAQRGQSPTIKAAVEVLSEYITKNEVKKEDGETEDGETEDGEKGVGEKEDGQ